MANIEVTEQQAGQNLAKEFGWNINAQGQIQMAEPAAGRMRDVNFERHMERIINRQRFLPIPPATVFNFLPFKVEVNSPMQAVRGGVPAADGKLPYATRTWHELAIEPFDTGDNGREPHEFLPHQVAKAFQDEFPQGGIIWMQGTAEDIAKSAEGKARLDKAAKDAVTYMRRQMEQGDRKWNIPGGAQRAFITLTERRCGQRLFDLGILKRLPDWVNAEVNLEDVPTITCVCGKKPDSRATVRCSCGHILDVAEAYRRSIIDEESVELERLTRKEVVDLGVSDYVAETADERKARVKAGVPKPPSKVQERMMDAAEQYEKRNAKK
jgi:hypothetical protein